MRFGFHHHHRGGRGGGDPRWQAMRGGFGGGGFAGRGFGRGFMDEEDGGRRRRLFDGGELRLVLLRLIADQPRHGYDLIRAIEERTGGAYAPSPGVVYPTLTLLADMGQIEEMASEGTRKLFAATAEGLRLLEEKAEEVAALLARLEAMGAMRGRSEHLAVRRAVMNLRTVLMHKLRGGDADAEAVHAIVALIDETAQKIERM